MDKLGRKGKAISSCLHRSPWGPIIREEIPPCNRFSTSSYHGRDNVDERGQQFDRGANIIYTRHRFFSGYRRAPARLRNVSRVVLFSAVRFQLAVAAFSAHSQEISPTRVLVNGGFTPSGYGPNGADQSKWEI